METVCVDTETLWQFLLNKKEVVELLLQVQKNADLAVTSLSLFELYTLAAHSEKPIENKVVVDVLAKRLTVLAFHASQAEAAAAVQENLLREKKKIELRDLWEGVMVSQANYAILTANPEHYKDIPGVKIYK